jgi:hypothetical protein
MANNNEVQPVALKNGGNPTGIPYPQLEILELKLIAQR